jgi:hypothetical protein
MTYYHSDDIDVKREFAADDLDANMTLCINRITASFNKLEKTHPESFSTLMEELFQSFLSTHRSIRLLLRQTQDDPDFASDAMSLVREQVEKIFVISLILDDYQRWMWTYFQDDWIKLLNFKFLTEAEETKDLPRFAGWKEDLEKRLAFLKDYSQVSDSVKELAEHKFNNPGVARPAHLAGVEIPQFPTPRVAIEKIADADTKQFLMRWHKEYVYLCGYSHIGSSKLMTSSIQKTRLSEENKKEYVQRELVMPAVELSYIAVASMCSEAWNYLIGFDGDLSKSDEFLEAIFDFWDELKNLSLKGNLFWNIRAKNILPPLIGSP